MAQLFTNNAQSTLAANLGAAATSMSVAAGDGAMFPSPSGGDFFVLTLYKQTGSTESAIEIVKVTARSGDTMTVVRAQEGTVANTYLSGDKVALRLTAGSMNTDAVNEGANNKYFTVSRVLNAALAGIDVVTSAAVTAADSVITAIGKLQAQITGINNSKDANNGYAGLTAFKINFKNVANTFTSYFTNTNTASRTYTFPDKDIVVAGTNDIPALATIAPMQGSAVAAAGSANTSARADHQHPLPTALASGSVLPINQGGTGASSASSALAGLGGMPAVGGVATGPSYTHVDKGTAAAGTVTFDYSAGDSQRLQVAGALTIALSNIPTTGRRFFLFLELVNAGSVAVTFPSINWIKPDGTFTTSIAAYLTAVGRTSLQASGTDFIMIFGRDGGTTLYGKLI